MAEAQTKCGICRAEGVPLVKGLLGDLVCALPDACAARGTRPACRHCGDTHALLEPDPHRGGMRCEDEIACAVRMLGDEE